MKRWLDSLYGPYSINRWSWFVTLVVALVNSPQLSVANKVPLFDWIVAVVIVHIACIPILFFARWNIQKIDAFRLRIACTITHFALFGAFRAFALSIYAARYHDGNFAKLLQGALPSYISIATVTLIGVAVVINRFRAHAATMARLEGLQRNLEAIREAEDVEIRSMQEELLNAVKEAIQVSQQELLESSSESSEKIASKLRDLAENVVRPLSHELIFGEAPVPVLKNQDPREARPLLAIRDLVSRAKPNHILLVPIVLEALITPFLFSQYGWRIASLNFILSTPSLILANFLLRKLWPQRNMSIGCASALIFAYWLAGGICALPIFLFSKLTYLNFPLYWGNSFFFLMFSLLFASNQVLEERRAELQTDVSLTLKNEATEIANLQSRIAQARFKLGKFLHSRVQGDLVASAMKILLNDELEKSEVIFRLNESTKLLFNFGLVPNEQMLCEEEISDMLGLWSKSLVIRLDASPNVWNFVEEKVERKEALIDILSEGLTNAVKYGVGRSVNITLAVVADKLNLKLFSPGEMTRASRTGAGLKIIGSAVLAWDLEAKDGKTVLSTVIT